MIMHIYAQILSNFGAYKYCIAWSCICNMDLLFLILLCTWTPSYLYSFYSDILHFLLVHLLLLIPATSATITSSTNTTNTNTIWSSTIYYRMYLGTLYKQVQTDKYPHIWYLHIVTYVVNVIISNFVLCLSK